MTNDAAETPFTELMARIPRGEALSWYEANGFGAYCHAPVGEYVHRALALINAQAAEIAALKAAMRASFDEHGSAPTDCDCSKCTRLAVLLDYLPVVNDGHP